MKITSQYGFRLKVRSNSITEEGLNKLVTSYPEHGFVIGKEEAREIFSTVTDTDEHEEALIKLFHELFMTPSRSIVSRITLDNLRDCNGYDQIQTIFEGDRNAHSSVEQPAKETCGVSAAERASEPVPDEQQSVDKQDPSGEAY